MQAHRVEGSSADAGAGTLAVLVGGGILTFTIFPLAVPGLLVFAALPLAVLALPALPVLALAALVVVPIRLGRRIRRRRGPSGRAAPAVPGPRGCPSPRPSHS